MSPTGTPASDPTDAVVQFGTSQGEGFGFGGIVSMNVSKSFPGIISNRAIMYFDVTNGLVLGGEGSTFDMIFVNQNGDGVFVIPDGTQTGSFLADVAVATTITQGTYVVRKHVSITGQADDNNSAFFTITTTDETGSADGGSYTVKIHLLASEAVAASGATNVSSMSGIHVFNRVMQSAGTGANSAVSEVLQSAGADAGTGAIVSIDVTVAETSEFVQQISLQVDTSGGTFSGFALVEVVYSVFTTAPVIN